MPSASDTRKLFLSLTLIFVLAVSSRELLRFVQGRFHGNRAAESLVYKAAPDFELATLSGVPVTLAQYRGKRLVVSFWASWCGPCREELPELQEFYQKYHMENSRFELLAISIDDSREDAQRYADESTMTFPVLWDQGGRIGFRYGVGPIPALFVVDENGTVTYFRNGYYWGLQRRLKQELGLTNPSIPGSSQVQIHGTIRRDLALTGAGGGHGCLSARSRVGRFAAIPFPSKRSTTHPS